MSAMPDVDASGVIQARRRGLATRFVAVVIAGPGRSAQLAALRPLALLLVGLPTFTLAVAGGRLARAPSMSRQRPTNPSVSRAPGSRALSRAKDMGSQAWDSGPAATL